MERWRRTGIDEELSRLPLLFELLRSIFRLSLTKCSRNTVKTLFGDEISIQFRYSRRQTGQDFRKRANVVLKNDMPWPSERNVEGPRKSSETKRDYRA
jgi:hypothetical protein